MKTTIFLTTILSAISLTHAAPAPSPSTSPNPNTSHLNHLQARASDTCGTPSHFIDETSDASPLWEDCRTLLRSIVDDDSDKNFELTRGGWIMGFETEGSDCVFGARRLDTGWWVEVGRQDVVDLLTDGLGRADFGYGDKLGIRGEFSCNQLGWIGDAQVQFSISHRRDW